MTPHRRPRILVSAGEPSGDLHGAGVVRALFDRFPEARIDAVGGPRMAAAGAEVLHPMEQLSAFGLVEVIGSVPAHYRLLRRLRTAFRSGLYDLVVLIDYPGFHLRLAEAAHRTGTPVLYYVAPQLWAWRPERARRLAGAVDRLAVILPFEEAFFRGLGIPAQFVGHPLTDRADRPDRATARAALGAGEGERILAVFPGSRGQEIRLHWDIFRAAANGLLTAGRCDRVVVAATATGEYPDPGRLVLYRGDPGTVFAAADAAIAKSGTTTLEAALADVPMVVAYRSHPLTYRLAMWLMTVQWVSLVNLVAEREVVPELLQDAVTVDALVEQLGILLDPDHPTTRAQRAGLAEVRRRLGPPGAADRVAALAAELLPS